MSFPTRFSRSAAAITIIAAAAPCWAQEENGSALTESSEELSNLTSELEEKREGSQTYRFDPLRPVMDPWNNAWRWVDQELGVHVGFAYTALYQAATKGSYGERATGGVGDLDIFGTWDIPFVSKSTGLVNQGTIGFNFEQRDSLDGLPPSELGNTIGSLWGTTSGFNLQEFSAIQYWWQQKLFDEHLGFRVGKIDLSSIFDVYRFNSANHFFNNNAFADNPTIPFPENGLGGVILGEVFYRMEVFPELRLTPHAQIIVNPSRNTKDDVLAIFGLRARFVF